MRYSLGESLADFGFNFLEKLHEPIFLVNRVGRLLKVNEAGRKFLRVTRLTARELESFLTSSVIQLFRLGEESTQRVPLGEKGHLIARSFAESDVILIEVVH